MSGDAAPVATPHRSFEWLAVARRSPATALTANIACASINHLAACGVSSGEDASGIRADGDARQHDSQQQREDRAKSAQQDRRVAKPQDLHAQRRESGECECSARENDGRWSVIGKEDIVRNLATGFGFRRDRGSIAGDGRKRQCAGTGDHVERDGDHLRPQKPNGGDEREVGEEAAKRGADCVGGVETAQFGPVRSKRLVAPGDE